MIQRPEKDEYAEYYADYVRRVPDGDICEILDRQLGEVRQVYSRFTDEEAARPRKEKEWTLKQVLGHLCDGERIFGYRALRIARGDQTPLAGFDQDVFVNGGGFNERTLEDLLLEFEHLRAANVVLYRAVSEDDSRRVGNASGHPVSARALMYITAGHAGRHLELIRQRFGSSPA